MQLLNPHAWFRNGAIAVIVAFSVAALADTYTVTDLGTLGDGSYAYGINANGQVVGTWSLSAENGVGVHAFLYSGGGMTDLGALAGGRSVAYAINATGQVVGASGRFGADLGSHAFCTAAARWPTWARWGASTALPGVSTTGDR